MIRGTQDRKTDTDNTDNKGKQKEILKGQVGFLTGVAEKKRKTKS